MTSPFDFINSISHTKIDLLKEVPESDYNPFIVNLGLSQYNDTVLYANEMNMHPGLPKKLQYDYLRLSVWKAKRYSKWNKKDNLQDIEIIQNYYQCNIEKASDILKILSKEQLEDITRSFFKGGN